MQSAAHLTKFTATVATLLLAACAGERTDFDSKEAPAASTTDSSGLATNSAPSGSTIDPDDGSGDEPSGSSLNDTSPTNGETDEGESNDDDTDREEEADDTTAEDSADDEPETEPVDSETGDTSAEDVESDATETSVDDDQTGQVDAPTDEEEPSCAKVGGCEGDTPVCDNNSGRCVACVKDDVTCTESGDLATCTPDGEWEEEPCSVDAPYCVDAKCLTCDPSDPSTCEVDLCEGVVCAASDECHAVGVCDPGTGMCTNPTATNGHACDDGDECTQSDTCQAGQCVGANPVVCPASDECHNIGVCDSATGACSAPTNASNGGMCDDGDGCTESDSCQAGACYGTQIFCNSPPACKLNTTCSAGQCSYTESVPDGTKDTKCAQGTQYCSSGACVQCLSDVHCSGATPSCNTGTHQCACRMKSSGNILNNPGFDGSTTGWTNVTTSTDADGCAQSNSAYLMGSGDSANTLVCVTLPGNASTYYFGGKFKDGGALSEFSLSFWNDSQCSGTKVGSNTSLKPNATSAWTSASLSLTVPQGAVALRIQGVTLNMYMDQVYFNTENHF